LVSRFLEDKKGGLGLGLDLDKKSLDILYYCIFVSILLEKITL